MSQGQRIVLLFGSAAGTLLLMWAASVLGPVGMLLAILTPVPASYVHMRHGTADGLFVVSLATAVVFTLDGLPGVLLYLVQYGLCSLLLPLFLRRQLAWDRSIVVSTLATAGAGLAMLYGYAAQTGRALNDVIIAYVQAELEKVITLYQQADLTPSQLDELRNLAAKTAEFLVMTYPGLVIAATAGLMLLVVFLLARFSRGNYLIAGAPLPEWKAPDALIWLVILGGFGVFFAKGVTFQVAVNVLTVVLPIFFLQGIAVVSHYFRCRGISPVFRAFGYMMMVVINPLPAIVTGIGIFDIWVDFRKPRNKKS